MKTPYSYVATLKSLEEIEGVILAATLFNRRIPQAESAVLEARIVSLRMPATADQADQLIISLRAKTQRLET